MLTALGACGSGGSGNVNLPEGVPTQAVAINVVSALVTPAFSLDSGGGPVDFPVSEYDDGNLVLRGNTPATASDMVPLGSSHDNNPQAVRVVQGDYDVLYQHETGDSVPQNMDMPVQTGETIDADRVLPIAVTAVNVRPTFTLNTSATFPVSEYDDGVFYLQPSSGGERIFLGNSHTATPDNVLVMPGTYDVVYALETGGDVAPNNQNAVVMPGVSIVTDRALVVDVPAVDFRFDASLDGGVFPASQYQKAEFFLRSSSGDLVNLGVSFELPITVSVVEGTYDIVYRHVQGDQLPVNTDAVVASGLLIGTPGTNGGTSAQNIAMTSVGITPQFTLNGGAFPQSEYNDANFFLRGSTDEDVMLLGASEIASPASVRVVPGNYDVLYRHETGTEVPQNTNAVVLENQPLTMDGGLAVDVPTVNVAGVFRLNGNAFPADTSNSVRFLLRDADNAADEFLFGLSDIVNEAVKIIPNTYDVIMDHLDGSAVPQNEMHEVSFSNVLDMDMTLRVNVPVVRVDPSFSLDGVPFPVSIYQSATFYLRDIHTGRRIFLGRSYKDNDPVMVIKEDHEIIYEHTSGDQVPQNLNKLLQLIDL